MISAAMMPRPGAANGVVPKNGIGIAFWIADLAQKGVREGAGGFPTGAGWAEGAPRRLRRHRGLGDLRPAGVVAYELATGELHVFQSKAIIFAAMD